MIKKILVIFIMFFIYPSIVYALDDRVCSVCSSLGVNEYYIDNLTIGQRVEPGDVIYRSYYTDVASEDPNAIGFLYNHPGQAYSVSLYFDDVSLGGTASFGCVVVGYPHNTSSSNYPVDYPFDKNTYYILESVVNVAQGEAYALYFKGYQKSVDLSISTLVNGQEKYESKVGETLDYEIIIRNDGDGFSQGNTIKISIPTGLTIIDGSISDHGIFDKDNRMIIWNVDELKPNEEYSLTYKVLIEQEQDEYISNSIVVSNQVSSNIVSNDAVVEIVKNTDNPVTKSNAFIIIILMLSLFVIYIFYQRKKLKQN